MEQRPPKPAPARDTRDPFRKPVIRPDEKEDQADSGPDRDNPVTQESNSSRPQPR